MKEHDDVVPAPLPSSRVGGLRALRWLALVMALGGLLLLHRAARQRELPLVRAADLSPSMQFAAVRAAGVMTRPARIHRRDGDVIVAAFSLSDQDGELQVVAFGETARRLVLEERLPQPEDEVEVAGVLQFSSRYGPQIHIRFPENVAVRTPAVKADAP